MFSFTFFGFIIYFIFFKPLGLCGCGYYQLPIFVHYIFGLISIFTPSRVCTERSVRYSTRRTLYMDQTLYKSGNFSTVLTFLFFCRNKFL